MKPKTRSIYPAAEATLDGHGRAWIEFWLYGKNSEEATTDGSVRVRRIPDRLMIVADAEAMRDQLGKAISDADRLDP